MPYEKIGKNDPVCIADEVPFEIPESWEWVRLGSVCQLNDGKKLQSKTYNNLDARYMRGKAEAKVLEAGKFVTKGTYLILVDGENSGEVFIAPEDGYMGSTFKILWISAQLYARYILKFIELYKEPLRNSKKGAAIPHLNKEIFFNLDKIVELTPSVERYDLLSRRSDELNRNFPNFLKKSILQYAVQGKLVSQDPTDEPASVLLEHIRAEKEKLIKSGKIKRDKHESVIFRRDNSYYERVDGIERCIDDEMPFEIPESWRWTRWGTVATSIQYGYNAPAKQCGRIRMVRISDIHENLVTWTTVPFCDIDELDISTYLLQPNDILFARTGGTVGKSFLVRDVPYEAIYAGYLIRTRYSALLCPQYLKYFMESPLYWQQLKTGTTATAQPNCNGQTLSNMLLPLPPAKEQYRIVEKINRAFAKVK
uniref:restriction endonuclease subunit S n=1 Tax=Gemmiger formicilis TaxID=745368 RepID=UPI003FF03C0F